MLLHGCHHLRVPLPPLQPLLLLLLLTLRHGLPKQNHQLLKLLHLCLDVWLLLLLLQRKLLPLLLLQRKLPPLLPLLPPLYLL